MGSLWLQPIMIKQGSLREGVIGLVRRIFSYDEPFILKYFQHVDPTQVHL